MMIRINTHALPYLSVLSVLGSASSASALKAVNEFCGFYQEELTDQNEKSYIDCSRFAQGMAWLIFSAFSGWGCYLIFTEFSDTQSPKIDEKVISTHQKIMDHFESYYIDRYQEKNTLRNLCWNYLESSAGYQMLNQKETPSSLFQSISTYAYEAYHGVTLEANAIKKQLQVLRIDFENATEPLRTSLENYDVARGVKIDFYRLCQTPFGWLNTKHCSVQQKLMNQTHRYSLREEQMEEYAKEVLSPQKIEQCQKAYSIGEDFKTVYNLGKSKAENNKPGWFSTINLFSS